MIVAMDDGGRWSFETSGDPLPFERLDAYERPRKRDRFPPELLHEYLLALGAPAGAVVVERRRGRFRR